VCAPHRRAPRVFATIARRTGADWPPPRRHPPLARTHPDKVLGSIDELEEDNIGARYAVSLFDSVPSLIREGIEAEQYGGGLLPLPGHA
jgi:hypothetical protein